MVPQIVFIIFILGLCFASIFRKRIKKAWAEHNATEYHHVNTHVELIEDPHLDQHGSQDTVNPEDSHNEFDQHGGKDTINPVSSDLVELYRDGDNTDSQEV
jgi:hypothetical protein